MALTIQLDEAVLAALRDKAGAAGVTVEEFAQKILEREVGVDNSHYHPKLRAYLDKVECLRGTLGPVPEGALDPELMYGDR